MDQERGGARPPSRMANSPLQGKVSSDANNPKLWDSGAGFVGFTVS
jgi:hypothetical protein